MEDPYRNIGAVPENVLERLAEALEARSESAAKCGMRTKVLKTAMKAVGSSGDIVVIDVGCGTGSVTQAVAAMPGVKKVYGFDASSYFLQKAREKVGESDQIEFHEALCTDLPVPDNTADLVIFMHVLTHIDPNDHLSSLKEARRVLRPGGHILLKDNDLPGWCLTNGPTDILNAPVDNFLSAWSENKYLCRQYPALLEQAGFVPDKLNVYCTVDDSEDSYGFQFVLMRSIKMYVNAGFCSEEMGELLKQEALQRIERKLFQCVLTYGVILGYKQSTGYRR